MRLSSSRSLLRLITVVVVGCGVYFVLGTGSVAGQAICNNCGSSFQSPTARPGGPYVGMTGQNISLDGSGSWSGDDGWITGYYWNFGDGTAGSGSNPNHQYNADGVYTVTLSVSESNGNWGSSQTFVTVNSTFPGLVSHGDTANQWQRRRHHQPLD